MSHPATDESLADRIEALDLPMEARADVQGLCEKVFGDDCGRLENVRLVWEVPPAEAGRPAEREGWRVYECDVAGRPFAVPEGTPIPTILADHFDADGESEGVLYRYVHPKLVDDQRDLRDRLVQGLRADIRGALATLSTSFNLLSALRDVEGTLDAEDAHPDGNGPGEQGVGPTTDLADAGDE